MTDGDRATVSISIVGLPESGKTTFLAALWEIVNERRVAKKLSLHSIGSHDLSYLRLIVRVWRSAKEQARTRIAGFSSVRMNLQDEAGRVVEVVMPDAPGEEFRSMWEERELGKALQPSLADSNIMLLLNGERVKAPAWVTEREAQKRATKGGKETAEAKGWEPSFAPTQVQLVGLLQQISHPPVGGGGRKIVVMISAWDRSRGEGLSPEQFLQHKLPLLAQYLEAGRDGWIVRVYGVSAQGGIYDENDDNIEAVEGGKKRKAKRGRDADQLRDEDIAANRIQLVFGTEQSNDLTEPLEWLTL